MGIFGADEGIGMRLDSKFVKVFSDKDIRWGPSFKESLRTIHQIESISTRKLYDRKADEQFRQYLDEVNSRIHIEEKYNISDKKSRNYFGISITYESS